jgi:hypothetical protein
MREIGEFRKQLAANISVFIGNILNDEDSNCFLRVGILSQSYKTYIQLIDFVETHRLIMI